MISFNPINPISFKAKNHIQAPRIGANTVPDRKSATERAMQITEKATEKLIKCFGEFPASCILSIEDEIPQDNCPHIDCLCTFQRGKLVKATEQVTDEKGTVERIYTFNAKQLPSETATDTTGLPQYKYTLASCQENLK